MNIHKGFKSKITNINLGFYKLNILSLIFFIATIICPHVCNI
ncbi:hypothetical protein CBB_0826 [Clostridium botulinum Bf]|nr:hypothetical protein CBB_0826 [Clostridium botulinum Bf]